MGPTADLDRCEKYRPPPGFDLRTVQPVASRYTDCAIPANTTDERTNHIHIIVFTTRGCNSSQSLTDGVNRQMALTCTYFHLLETFRVLQILIVQ